MIFIGTIPALLFFTQLLLRNKKSAKIVQYIKES